MWREENKLLPVTLTSAVELDPELVSGIGERIERADRPERGAVQPGGPRGAGGIVLQVGNMVLDASVRNRLDNLRKSVAKAA